MKSFYLVILFLSIYNFAQSQVFEQKQTDIGNIGLNITNVGTIGRPNIGNDPTGPPSMEYPKNTGIEHLFEGGLWIGAYVNNQVRVSTGAMDNPTGYGVGKANFEFTQLSKINERSSLSSSDKFSGSAVSHQDFFTTFTDSFTVNPVIAKAIPEHDYPLKAVVNLETYTWNFSFADYFVILNFDIINKSKNDWDSVYLGLWTDIVVRNVNVTQDKGTEFFNKGGGGYIDTFKSLYAYQVRGDDVEYTRSYGASQILGLIWNDMYFFPSNKDNILKSGYRVPKINANFWNYKKFEGGTYGAPEDDLQKFQKLSNGLDFSDPNGKIPTELKVASNKTQLLSIGAVPKIKAGDTLNFTMAIVTAKQIGDTDNEEARKELMQHLSWARRTYLGEDTNGNGILDDGEDLDNDGNLDRYILPEPPSVPKVKVISKNNSVELYWDKSSVFSVDPISKKMDFEGFKIYKTKIGDDLKLDMLGRAKLIGTWDSTGNNIGYNNGFEAIELKEPKYFDGDTTAYHFHYKINGLLNGWQYMFIVTAFDKGDKKLKLEPLESSFSQNSFPVFTGTEVNKEIQNNKVGVYPNPYRTSAAWDGTTSKTKKIYFYNLPEKCKITIYTLGGDIVRELNHNASTYQGEDALWFSNFSSEKKTFSGGEHAWDLLSKNGQAVTQGLYIFSVKDLINNKVVTGKFAILK